MPPSSANEEQKQAALRYILDAWEDAVAKMANGLSRRIHHGEFTLKRTPQ
ncbi:MAG TPA: hypothetical protein VFR71_06815 [Methyloceanibacter sp.]|nr:hypothetical protein [Methyloceanibacter sp.]